jgi:dTDP-glucose 4,6-dehydratase
MKVLVTGCCGFIGSNFINYLLTDKEVQKDLEIINLDKQTYAGLGKNLEHMHLNKKPNYKFFKVDICNKAEIEKIFSQEKPELIINFAAESHVDRSIVDAEAFRQSNFEGTGVLLDTSIRHNVSKFVQISTDEVYGSLGNEDRSSLESDPKYPRSAYSASKSGAEDLSIAAFETHKLPIVITRSSNNYGPYQFPEKILPLFITNLIQGKKVPLMWSPENPGLNVRDWLHVEDNCRAIWFIAKKGIPGQVYNISGENEKTNIAITKMLLKEFGVGEEMIEKVAHRKGHDFRYSIDNTKLKKLGFKYRHLDLEKEIKILVKWYRENENWWRPLKK